MLPSILRDGASPSQEESEGFISVTACSSAALGDRDERRLNESRVLAESVQELPDRRNSCLELPETSQKRTAQDLEDAPRSNEFETWTSKEQLEDACLMEHLDDLDEACSITSRKHSLREHLEVIDGPRRSNSRQLTCDDWKFVEADYIAIENEDAFSLSGLTGMIGFMAGSSSTHYHAVPTDDLSDSPDDIAHLSQCAKWQALIKLCLEDPSSSPVGLVFEYFMILCIFCSVICAIMETVPELGDNSWFVITESTFTLFFSVEIAMRYWTCDSTRLYFHNLFNIIDIISTLPGYSELALPFIKTHKEGVEHETASMQTLRLAELAKTIRLLRVLRLAKVIRKSESLVVVVKSIWGSLQGLGVLIAFVVLSTVITATVCFFFESPTEDTEFTSIPASIWWSASTILAVGYGDIVPRSVLGKITAIVTMLLGSVTTAVCIAVITSSFKENYERNIYMSRARSLQSRIQKLSSDMKGNQRRASKEQHTCQAGLLYARRNSKESVGSGPVYDDGNMNIAECVNQLYDMTANLLLRLETLITANGFDDSGADSAGERRCAHLTLDVLRKSSRLWFEQVRAYSEELLYMNADRLKHYHSDGVLHGR